MGSGPHRMLTVWRESMKTVEMVSVATRELPADEQFGLRSQVRRPAVCVPSNIAEGAARNSVKELLHYVGVANGSLAEPDVRLEGQRDGVTSATRAICAA